LAKVEMSGQEGRGQGRGWDIIGRRRLRGNGKEGREESRRV
jgi:hypothetical protein